MGSCDCQWNSADAKLRHAASAVLAMNTRAPMERVQDIGSLKILAQLRPDVRPKPSPVITLVFLRRFNKLEQPYHCSRSDSQLPNGNRLIKGCYFRLLLHEPFCLVCPAMRQSVPLHETWSQPST